MKHVVWFLFPFGLCVSSWSVAQGGITVDGSMGTMQSLSGSRVVIGQNLGKTQGNNLFHSFSDFNIAQGQTVVFTGSDALKNVISRVTGENPSIIDGTLQSDIKNANFYLINPHGITFNGGAQIDVPAAFHVSTADKLAFSQQSGVFYADKSTASQLSSQQPSAFGFLETSAATNGLLDINHAQLTCKTGQVVDLVAGNIHMEKDALLKSPVGEVRLVAMQGVGEVSVEKADDGFLPLPASTPSHAQAGQLIIDKTLVDTSGDAGGRVVMWADDTTISRATISANNEGNTDASAAQGIKINTNTLNVLSSSAISSSSVGGDNTGKAGVVSIDAQAVFVDSGWISSNTASNGDAGAVTIHTRALDIKNGGGLFSSATTTTAAATQRTGRAGAISITADDINVDGNHGYSYISSDTTTKGEAGSVSIAAKTMKMDSGWVSSDTSASGHAGAINLQVDHLEVLHSGGIYSASNSLKDENGHFVLANGNAGKITIAADTLNVGGGWISSNTYSNGQAGEVNIHANTLNVFDGGGIYSAAYNNNPNLAADVPVGNAGKIIIDAARLQIDGNKGYAYISSDTATRGNAGNIVIQADAMQLDRGAISSNTNGEGDAGAVALNTRTLTLLDKSTISSAANTPAQYAPEGEPFALITQAKAGKVTINATTSLAIQGGSINSNTQTHGNAGSIAVTTPTLLMSEGGKLSSSADNPPLTTPLSARGNAGDIAIVADSVTLTGERTAINSSTTSKGRAGQIDLQAKQVTITDNAIISSASFGETSSGQTGHIYLDTQKLTMNTGGKISIRNEAIVDNATPKTLNMVSGENPTSPVGTIAIAADTMTLDNAQMSSQSTGNANAGSIQITYANSFKLLNKAFINATSFDGQGGDVNIDSAGGVITLHNAGMATTATGATSNGGDMRIQSAIMVLDTGSLLASTIGGTGGNISLNLQSLIPSHNTLLQVGAAQFSWQPYSDINVIGASGRIQSTAPQLNLSGVLANMVKVGFDHHLLSQDYCARSQGSSLSKKGKGGLPRRAKDLQIY